jgi:hypothetical protein
MARAGEKAAFSCHHSRTLRAVHADGADGEATEFGAAAPGVLVLRNPSCAPGGVCQSFSVPRKIRQLIREVEQAGFARITGGKGSHRKFVHPR